jgi:hypothetical protein
MYIKFSVSYNFKSDFEHPCQAIISSTLPCQNFNQNFPEKQVFLNAEFVSPKTKFLGDYLHRYWGRYEESSHYRSQKTELYADNWNDLIEKVENYLEEQMSILDKVVENYQEMIETQPEDYIYNYKL